MATRSLYSPWNRFTSLEDKKQDCMAYINSHGFFISCHAWESVLKHRKGPGAGRGFVVVDLSTERDKKWILSNENLLNLVRTYDPQSTYVCLFTDGFQYTETGQELPVLLLSLDQQTKRDVESLLKKSGQWSDDYELDSKGTSSISSTSVAAPVEGEEKGKKDEGKEKGKERVDRVILDDGTPKCAACGKKEESGRDKFPVCGRCRQAKAARPAKYCSRECQQKDWPDHKRVCGK